MMLKYKKHPLLDYSENDVANIRRAFGLSDDKKLEQYIDTIEEWFQKQPHLVDAGIERDVIERMLILAKGSIERTKQRIERLYTLRTLTPDILQCRDTRSPPLRDVWKYYQIIVLPKLFNGCRINVSQFSDGNPDLYDFATTLKIGFMFADLRLKYDYCSGNIIVNDLSKTSFAHVTKLNPFLIKKCEALYQEGYGASIEGIHIVHSPATMDKLYSMMKQSLKPKILDRVKIHSSLEELHKCIPKEYLPEDFGGTEPSMVKLTEMWREDFESDATREFFFKSEKLCSNESKRIKVPGAITEMEGTFRKLDLD